MSCKLKWLLCTVDKIVYRVSRQVEGDINRMLQNAREDRLIW